MNFFPSKLIPLHEKHADSLLKLAILTYRHTYENSLSSEEIEERISKKHRIEDFL